jgi:hypothetical protein
VLKYVISNTQRSSFGLDNFLLSMKTYKGHGGEHPHILSPGTKFKLMISFMLWLFYHWRKGLQQPLDKWLGGSQIHYGDEVRNQVTETWLHSPQQTLHWLSYNKTFIWIQFYIQIISFYQHFLKVCIYLSSIMRRQFNIMVPSEAFEKLTNLVSI